MERDFYHGQLSINRDSKSPFWMVTFKGRDGRVRRRSTKVPVGGGLFEGERISAKLAERLAYQRGVQLALAEEKSYESYNNMSVRELFDQMLAGKLGRVSEATYKNARTDYAQFCSWLGSRAQAPARLLSRADVKAWVAARRQQVRAKTVGKALSAIRAAFAWALDAEIIPRNPCLGVRIPPDSRDEKVVHEAFTLEEVRLLLDKLPDEWASAVRCCIETYGQRLGDVLALRWDQFDWENRVVRLVTGKTGRALCQPMRDSFFSWARARFAAAQEKGEAFLHPRLRLLGSPSVEFTQLVRLHGIGIVGQGCGGSRKRWHSKTFHSLRATVATMLQVSGVSQGLAMELVGHESAQVHAAYIRPSLEQARAAAAALPVL